MVKCNSCGLDVDDNFENCPNCGSSLKSVNQDISDEKNDIFKCSSCGNEISPSDDFCTHCGNKIGNEDESLKCGSCGAQLPQNTLFCPSCGSKVDRPKKIIQIRSCPNCGVKIEDDDMLFCQECGTNINTGEIPKQEVVSQRSFIDKIDLAKLIKPVVFATISLIILSLIVGLLIGFSWLSFVIAIILSVGFFAGTIDNEANAIIFGLIIGIILGLLETPLVDFMYGAFVAGFYKGFFGSNIILFIIVGIITAYISNVYFKDNIQNIINNFKGMK